MPQPSQWEGQPSIRGSHESVQMMLLSFALLGMVITWGLEATYMTPYLLQLGLTKTKISFVWLAGPASSMITQPIVGALTDRSTSTYGRRRPTMVGAVIVTGLSLLFLGWTKEIVGLVMVQESDTRRNVVIVVAVLAVYVLDVSINVVGACGRSLIVDALPISKQQLGAAWSSRMGATGHIVGYGIGALDLVAWLPAWLGGGTQFKKMTVVGALSLWLTTGVTCWAVSERRLVVRGGDVNAPLKSVFVTLWYQCWHLPKRIEQICWVQFWSWIGWFPLLFYGSTWVGETYYRYEHTVLTEQDRKDMLGNIGRLGSAAFTFFSVVNFASTFIIPNLVHASYSTRKRRDSKSEPKETKMQTSLNQLRSSLSFLKPLQPGMVMTWMLANLLFAAIMVFAPVVRSVRAATLSVALSGISWAVIVWAPFAEIGAEINLLERAGAKSAANRLPPPVQTRGYAQVATKDDDQSDDEFEMEETSPSIQSSHSNHRRRRSLNVEDQDSSTGELAGVYLGVLNIYSTLPQFIGTGINWIVFLIFEPKRASNEGQEDDGGLQLQKDGPNAVAVCLFVGACCSVVAAEAGRRLRKMA